MPSFSVIIYINKGGSMQSKLALVDSIYSTINRISINLTKYSIEIMRNLMFLTQEDLYHLDNELKNILENMSFKDVEYSIIEKVIDIDKEYDLFIAIDTL